MIEKEFEGTYPALFHNEHLSKRIVVDQPLCFGRGELDVESMTLM